MQIEPGRNHPYPGGLERARGGQRAQQPQQPGTAGGVESARQTEAAQRSSPVRPAAQAAESQAVGSPLQPPRPGGGAGGGGIQPPELLASRFEGRDTGLQPRETAGSGGGGSGEGGRWSRIGGDQLPRGLEQLVEVQAMAQPELLGRGGRLDLTI